MKNLPSIVESDAYPSGGVVAARVAEMAALLAADVADHSREQWAEAAGARAQALALARRAAQLGERGAGAYGAARLALARRGVELEAVEPGLSAAAEAQAERDRRLGAAVAGAAEAPLELTARAADIAALAGEIAVRAGDDLRADAVIAALLAAAAARAAARLVEINLAVGEGAPPVVATEHAEAATAAAAAAAAL